jgi:hypothetical protein
MTPPPASLTVPHTLKLGNGGAGAVTVMCAEPVTFWKVARMSASPGPAAVTNPVEETVATAVFEDCHEAWFVTVCVVPFDMAAVAEN